MMHMANAVLQLRACIDAYIMTLSIKEFIHEQSDPSAKSGGDPELRPDLRRNRRALRCRHLHDFPDPARLYCRSALFGWLGHRRPLLRRNAEKGKTCRLVSTRILLCALTANYLKKDEVLRMENFLRSCQSAVLENEAKNLAAKMGVAHVSLLQRANPDNDAHHLTIEHLFGILLHT
ncbi:Prophage PssSM-02, c2 family phage regulatory protein [Pseudomonas syringae pv. papulans]|nr:Prophage PssSM-02, c2 family phage regulatory protein [Pseudomonas syringae pv. papulans]